jgi:undecaprenyl-diphosphatase
MEILSAIILGIVEGITEFLPISSTGHLLITEQVLNVHKSDAFNIMIQMGPILAVTLVYWRDISKMITDFGNKEVREELYKLAICFILTCILGFIIKKSGFSLPQTLLPVALSVLAGAVIILFAEIRVKKIQLKNYINWAVPFAVAAGQIVAAVLPGFSRSGAAIVAGVLVGLSRSKSTRFAFLVGIPTMLAAGVFELKETIFSGHIDELFSLQSIIAFAAATITAWLSVIWLLKFLQRNTLLPFAWYRFSLGIIMMFLFAIGIIT